MHDYHAAMVAHVMVNAFRGKKGKPVKLEDLMPDRRGKKAKKKTQSWQEQLEVVKMLHSFFTDPKKVPKKE